MCATLWPNLNVCAGDGMRVTAKPWGMCFVNPALAQRK